MRRIVITFGLISGALLVTMFAILMPLQMSGRIQFDQGEIIGYSAIVASFLLVFFGIRSYRENVTGGVITFGRAFLVGILITAVACAVYVVAWQIYYYGFDPGFLEKYVAFTIETMEREGATAAEIAAKRRQMADFAELYANPLANVAITFMEPFPVGLVVTLVSAAILRKKEQSGAGAAAETV